MFKLFRPKTQRLAEEQRAAGATAARQQERAAAWTQRQQERVARNHAALQGVEAVRDELQALGLTLESDVEFGGDGKFLDVGCTAPRDIGQRTFSLAASDIEGFCRVVKHISTVPPSFVTAATEAVGEELAAFGVAIASAFPKGFTVTQDGAEKAAHTVECADEAVFLAMTLALRRALQERQQAQQPEPEPAAGAQIISFAAEQARRQGEDETF